LANIISDLIHQKKYLRICELRTQPRKLINLIIEKAANICCNNYDYNLLNRVLLHFIIGNGVSGEKKKLLYYLDASFVEYYF
jgi:hypothetical protein